jgi:hypothetical protein
LERKEVANDVAMRFTRTENGWRLRPDRVRPDDTAFTHGGRKVLLVDATTAKAMVALRLEAKNTEAGPRLKLCRVTRESE